MKSVDLNPDGTFDEVELDGYRDTTDRQNLFFQGNLVGEFETGPIGHTVLVGAEYGMQDTDNDRRDNVFAENDDDQLFIPFSDPLVIPDSVSAISSGTGHPMSRPSRSMRKIKSI